MQKFYWKKHFFATAVRLRAKVYGENFTNAAL